MHRRFVLLFPFLLLFSSLLLCAFVIAQSVYLPPQGRTLGAVLAAVSAALAIAAAWRSSVVELDLMRTRERAERVIEAAQSGIVDLAIGEGRNYYSTRALEILGSRGKPRPPEDFVHPEDQPAVRQALADLVKHNKRYDCDFRVVHEDGKLVWVNCVAVCTRGARGRAERFVGALLDITERKAQEQALQDQIKLTRDLIDAVPNAIYMKDTQARYVWVNAQWRSITGLTPEQTEGRTVTELFPEQESARYDEVDRALLEGSENTSTIESMRTGPDGKPQWLIVSKAVLRRSDGSVLGLVGTNTDITALKQIEAELRASREEALQAAQAKAAFLATMSHEIRTPLNGVLGMAELLRESGLTPEQREYAETIQVSGDALLAIINDILDYSKIDSGHMELERAPLELARSIEESLDILGEQARAKQLELIYEVDAGVPPWIEGDAVRLRQVLVNLVGNAVKFTHEGEVFVGVSVTGPADADGRIPLEISVRDTGIGIAPERISALFDAFTQADASTTRHYGGTGLGLAICRRLVEIAGGTLSAESAPGRGSTFRVRLPVRAAEAASMPDEPPAPDLAGRRVLVVDDHATNRRVLAGQLGRWGVWCLVAAGAADALDLLAAAAARGDPLPDCAVLDYHMPGMDGLELARELRRRHPRLPLVLLSSSMQRRLDSAEAALFAAQVLKPARQAHLRQTIARAIAGLREPSPTPAAAARGAVREQLLAERLPLRILVVDDNETNRRLAVLQLAGLGYQADTASGGAEAVDAVAAGAGAQGYDLILMDVQMPGMDGLAATRAIVAAHGGARPRIVAMTANALQGDREACLAAGMDDYLAKPVQMPALRQTLERLALERLGKAAGVSERMPEAEASAAEGTSAELDRSRLEQLRPYDDAQGSMLREIVNAFRRDAPARIADMRAALAAGDAEVLRGAAHALKGAASNVGAVRLAQGCAQIESLVREGQPCGAEIEAAALRAEAVVRELESFPLTRA